MRTSIGAACVWLLIAVAWGCSSAGANQAGPKGPALQVTQAPNATLFSGPRIIIGESRPPIEDGALLVEGTRITAVGRRGEVTAPPAAVVVDLRGKTIIPALIDGHSHLGYTDVRSMTTAAANYTRDNLLDHLRRDAYY